MGRKQHLRRPGLAAVMVAAVVAGTVSSGRTTTANVCLGRKLTAVGKAVVSTVTCYARNAAKPDADRLAACLDQSAARFAGNATTASVFDRIERRPPCLTSDDASAEATAVGDYTAGLDATVGNDGASNRCDAAVLMCLGRYVPADLGCLARGGGGVAGCLAKARVRLLDQGHGCLHAAAVRGSCSTPIDPAALANAADAFVADTLCALDPPAQAGCPGLPTPVPTPTRTATPVASGTPTPVATPGGDDVAQDCVDDINAFRASIGLPPYARWDGAESCVDAQAAADAASQIPHSAFGQCGEFAQDECPGWPGPPADMIGACLQAMWNEGPGSDFHTHGHYINMSSQQYTQAACGFHVLPNGAVWATQDFR